MNAQPMKSDGLVCLPCSKQAGEPVLVQYRENGSIIQYVCPRCGQKGEFDTEHDLK